ncbi:Tyrosine decarboxylase 1 [Platanthera zijinensis]|uniref:Tyrosine decarboxylase 1 n=1 Tax=Platanthera zijinensis TaxID=2320716 RepID=A0AAP0B200_9ASPA
MLQLSCKNVLKIEIVEFLAGLGGGVIQGTASKAILISLLAARDKILGKDGIEYLSKLTVYASDQTHSALKKACQRESGRHGSHAPIWRQADDKYTPIERARVNRHTDLHNEGLHCANPSLENLSAKKSGPGVLVGEKSRQ